MARPLLIVLAVGLLMATGVALAAPVGDVQLPVNLSDSGSEDGPADQVVVVRGDHLWKISARHLEQHSPESRVAPYWLRVIEVNTPSLRSGDPDLIYPGEVVVLPGLTERP